MALSFEIGFPRLIRYKKATMRLKGSMKMALVPYASINLFRFTDPAYAISAKAFTKALRQD